MPLRPFPLPITVGTDICSIQRVFQLLGRATTSATGPSRLARRVLTPRELQSRWLPHADALARWTALRRQSEALGGMERRDPAGDYDRGKGYTLSSGFGDGLVKDWSEFPFTLGRHSQGDQIVDREIGEDGAAVPEALDESKYTRATSFESPATSDKISQETMRELPSVFTGDKTLIQSKDAEVAQPQVGPTDPAQKAQTSLGDEQKSENENVKASQRARDIHDQLDKLFPEVWNLARFLAGRFAAKEAAMKAYQSRRLTYQDIEILSPPQRDGRSQAPVAMVKPEDGDWDDAQIVPMSISHDGGFATAVCMAYEKSAGAV